MASQSTFGILNISTERNRGKRDASKRLMLCGVSMSFFVLSVFVCNISFSRIGNEDN